MMEFCHEERKKIYEANLIPLLQRYEEKFKKPFAPFTMHEFPGGADEYISKLETALAGEDLAALRASMSADLSLDDLLKQRK